jgi:transcriptional regulator
MGFQRQANVGAHLALAQDQNCAILPFCSDRRGQELKEPADVIQGTLDLLILKALSLEPMHGWGISDRIREMSAGVFLIGQGSLYPALHRFDNRGWVTSYWKTTQNNRIARYYELSAAGRHALAEEVARWRSYTGAVDLVIGAGPRPSTL